MPDLTPDYEKLIAGLRESAKFLVARAYMDSYRLETQAADAIEALKGEVARSRTQRAAIIKAWDAWYDGPETRVPNDIVEAMVALKESE